MASNESRIDTLVPQITLVDCPPSMSASEVFGLRLEKVAVSDAPPGIGLPFSSTNNLLRPLDGSRMSELMSCLLLRAAVAVPDRGDRTKRPVELVRSALCPLAVGSAASELVA